MQKGLAPRCQYFSTQKLDKNHLFLLPLRKNPPLRIEFQILFPEKSRNEDNSDRVDILS